MHKRLQSACQGNSMALAPREAVAARRVMRCCTSWGHLVVDCTARGQQLLSVNVNVENGKQPRAPTE